MIVWSGFAFVALFLASLVMLGDLAGSFADSDAHFMAYHSSQSNQIQVVVGGYLITATGLALLVFLTGLTAPSENAPVDYLRLLAFVSGIVGVALFIAGGAALVTSASAKTFGAVSGDAPLTGDAVAVAPQLGYVLIFLPAMLGFGPLNRDAHRAYEERKSLAGLALLAERIHGDHAGTGGSAVQPCHHAAGLGWRDRHQGVPAHRFGFGTPELTLKETSFKTSVDEPTNISARLLRR